MMWKLILWSSIAPLPALMYFVLRNETKFKKNIALSVTLPYQARSDHEVLELLARFKRQILWINLGLLLILIPFLLIDSQWLMMSVYMTWVLFAMVLPMVAYVRTNLALKRLKAARGWKRVDQTIRHVNLAAVPPANWISPWAFLPGIVISFLPIIWDRAMFPLYLTFGLTALFFWFGYRYLYRNKSEMVDQNTELTRVLTRVRRYNWGKVWLLFVYSFALMSLIGWLLAKWPFIQLVAIILVSFIMTIFAIRVEFRTRRVQEELTKDSGKDWYVDDDDYWLGGVVYYNPNDSRLLINSRVGMNSTFNLAKTSGKILAGGLVLMLLAMPFTGLFLRAVENQPISLELSQQSLIAHRGRNQAVMALSDIEQVELLTELPKNMTRNWGSGFDRQLSGRFSAPGYGAMELSLDPTKPPYLLVTLHDGTTYLIGSRDTTETEEIYRRLNR